MQATNHQQPAQTYAARIERSHLTLGLPECPIKRFSKRCSSGARMQSFKYQSTACTARHHIGVIPTQLRCISGCSRPRHSTKQTKGSVHWQTLGRRRQESHITHVSNLQEEVLLPPWGWISSPFLAATVLVIPIFKSVKASPVLGFLFTGLVLGQLG